MMGYVFVALMWIIILSTMILSKEDKFNSAEEDDEDIEALKDGNVIVA